MTGKDNTSGGADERPAGTRPNAPGWGSDVAAEALRALGIPYIALNPGASYRGLHDSLVNYLGNEAPQMLLCLHEEHAVAIAHGYAKVTGRAMAAAVHSNVGLFHATMAIFNAWCDRMPVMVIGATGPRDAARRRPWIEWIHTARDQGAIVRGFTKWDDEPASPLAARESLARAKWLAETAPQGPVYVNLDLGLQEMKLAEPLPPFEPARLTPAMRISAGASLIAEAAALLKGARAPVLMIGRVSRDRQAWEQRVSLAEATGARVVTDLRVGAAFPSEHPLHAGLPGSFPVAGAAEALRAADVIVSLDWVDLAGTLKTVFGEAPAAKIVQVSPDHAVHRGWSMDYQGLPPVDLMIAADPDAVVADLCAALGARAPAMAPKPLPLPAKPSGEGELTVAELAAALRHAVGDRAVSLAHLPLSWDGGYWPFRDPLDFLGSDGGGGVGGGPGISVGAALALKDSGRLVVSICGDGDFLMGATAVWTAVHYRLPLLLVVANNRSYFNDEVHQERVARTRDRPVENKWIGQRMSDPDINIAGMARDQGATGFGPISDRAALAAAYRDAIAVVEKGGVAVIDVRVATGYTPAMQTAMTRSSD